VEGDEGFPVAVDDVGVAPEVAAEQGADQSVAESDLVGVGGSGGHGERLVELVGGPPGGRGPAGAAPRAGGGGALGGGQVGDELLVAEFGAQFAGVGEQAVGPVDGRDGGVGVQAAHGAHVAAEDGRLDGFGVHQVAGDEQE